MDPGNLSRLARNHGVPVDDEDALICLGRSRQRAPAPDGDYVVPVKIAVEQIRHQYEAHNLHFQQRNRKFKKFQEDGAKILKDLIQESTILRQFILQSAAALAPVLGAPWHGKDGINLTAEQTAAIQDCFGDDLAESFDGLREQQQTDLGLLAGLESGKPQASAAFGFEHAQEESNDLCLS
jgi:hypothetical protein